MKVTHTPRPTKRLLGRPGDVLHLQHVSDKHQCVALVTNAGHWIALHMDKEGTYDVFLGDVLSKERYITLGIYEEAELVLGPETLF